MDSVTNDDDRTSGIDACQSKQATKKVAKGAAGELLAECPKILDDLCATHHLGVLVPLAKKAYSRLDYVRLQLSNILLFKQHYRGLGLSSEIGALGPLPMTSKLAEETGLVLMQLWAVTKSWGHLFGTFATERALLWALTKDPKQFQAIMNRIDVRLRPGCWDIFNNSRWYSMVNITAAWRLSAADLPDKHKELLIAAHQLYLSGDQDPQLVRFKRLFKKLRQLSYLSLQTRSGIGGVEMLIQDDNYNLVRQLLRRDGVKYHSFAECDSEFTDLLGRIDEYHYETFFTGDEASKLVLNHLREFKPWWEHRRADTNSALAELYSRPTDWRSLAEKPARQRAKFQIPLVERQWIEEADRWYDTGTPWPGNSNFYLTFPPHGTSANVCIYADGLGAKTAHHIAQNLARLQSSAGNYGPLSRSIGTFALLLLQDHLKKGLEALLEPVEQRADLQIIGLASRNPDELVYVMRRSISNVVDPGRRKELKPLSDYLQGLELVEGGVRIVLVSQLHVMKRSRAQDQFAEIDGFVCDVGPDWADFHFLEFKKTNARASSSKQLENFANLLVNECEGPDPLDLSGSKSSVLRLKPG